MVKGSGKAVFDVVLVNLIDKKQRECYNICDV